LEWRKVLRINITNIANKLLPEKLVNRLQPVLQVADAILSGSDDNARSQRTALIVFIIRVASAVIAFFSQVILARWLGTFEYGIFVAVWVIVIFAGTVASIGLPSAVTRLIAEYQQQKLPSLLQGAVRSSVQIAFISSTLLAILGAILVYYYPDIVEKYYITPIYLAAICLPMLSIEGVSDGIARAFNWTYVAFLPTYIMRPLGIIFVIGVAHMLGYSVNSVTAMWGGVISCYVTTLFQLAFIMKKLSNAVPSAQPQYQLKYWLVIAMPIFLVEGFYVLQTSVDVMLITAYLTPQDTAIYFASTKILALVHFVYFAVKAAVSHRYTAFHKSGDIEAFRNFVQKTVMWTFWPSLILGCVMMLVGKYFLMLFGPEFVSGTHLIWILAIGIILRASVGPAEALLVMAGGQTSCAFIYAITLGVNIALNISLIPIYGLAGAAIATTFALGFESAALHVVAKRKLKVHAFIIPQRNLVSDSPA